MTYETAHKILSAHQAWRRGLVDVMEYTAAEVNEALELAITALQSDPNAPDWSQAPKWARWYAIDIFGTECWFENEPTCSRQGVYFASSGKIDYCTKNRVQSLFKRPAQ